MKKIILLSLVAIALLLAVFGFQQARQRAAEQARLIETQRLLAETTAEAARQQARGEREHARLQEVNALLADKARETSQRQVALAPTRPPVPPAARGERSRFNEVHKDPEMKEAMRRQARQAVEKLVQQTVTTNLIQHLGLSGPQTAALKDLVTRKGTLGFEFMMPFHHRLQRHLDDRFRALSGVLRRGQPERLLRRGGALERAACRSRAIHAVAGADGALPRPAQGSSAERQIRREDHPSADRQARSEIDMRRLPMNRSAELQLGAILLSVNPPSGSSALLPRCMASTRVS